MRRSHHRVSLLLLGLSLFLNACSGGSEETFGKTAKAMVKHVGESCILEDEFHTDFPGFGKEEINISATDECGAGVCLANHFQGRVSCAEGQEEGSDGCETPDGASVTVPVKAQLPERPAESSVVCSCRCDGDGPGPFCVCPKSYMCALRLEDLGLGTSEETGLYCIPEGTSYDPTSSQSDPEDAR